MLFTSSIPEVYGAITNCLIKLESLISSILKKRIYIPRTLQLFLPRHFSTAFNPLLPVLLLPRRIVYRTSHSILCSLTIIDSDQNKRDMEGCGQEIGERGSSLHVTQWPQDIKMARCCLISNVG